MFLRRAILKNIRGFRDLDFSFERPGDSYAGWSVILGNNAPGKSTLLKDGVDADARETLLAAVMDNDHYGISCWFFHRDGAEESPFAELRNRFPEVSEAARGLISQ